MSGRAHHVPIGAGLSARHPLLVAVLAVLLLHVVGFGLLLAVVAPAGLHLGSGAAFGIGAGLTAYTLGMRHAFDADHIAAIDNTTRKLLHDGTRPHATGFFFSAGHSTVVFALTLLVALGVRGVGAAVSDDASTVHRVTAVWGPTVAGCFLLTIGLANLGVMRETMRLARRAGNGTIDAADLDHRLAARGPIAALTAGLARRITRPWQMYPLGLLFGLGFDTASEVALLVLAGGSAAGGLPIAAILCLPILFAAGMTLLDTINGAATARAYAWASAAPARRVAYNLAVTGVSVLFALVIGATSLLGVAARELNVTGGPLAAIGSVDTSSLGYVLLAVVLTTGSAAALWARAVERRLA